MALVAAGYQVYAINPLAASRYRDRHNAGGAKSDAGDAKMLADLVRTDRHNHRLIAGDTLEAKIQVLARGHQNLIWTRNRQTNALRSALREYYAAAFNEVTDASTVAKALDVLFVGGNNGSAKQTLDRQILTAWMNFANGAFTLTSLVDTDGVGGPDTAFGAVIANAEAVRVNASSTDVALRAQKAILERING